MPAFWPWPAKEKPPTVNTPSIFFASFFIEIVAGMIERGIGPRQGGAGRHGDQGEDRTGVLVGQEAGRKPPEEQPHEGEDDEVYDPLPA